MKHTLFNLLILCSAFFCIRCDNGNLVQISQTQENEFVNLTLVPDKQIMPIKITGDTIGKSGSVFLETSKGKTWLTGLPDEISNSKNSFIGKWNSNEREIIVEIEKKADQYYFSFQASPDSDILKWGFSIAASKDEYFTGLFERVVDGDQKESWKQGISEGMNLHGQEMDMIIKPTLSLYCPFYLSSNGYGLFVNGTWPGHYDLCKSDPDRVQIEFEGSSLSGIIYTSEFPSEIVRAHSLHVGSTIIPPKWVFLPWRWRDNHTDHKNYYDGTPANTPYNSMLTEDILMMNALDIPCGVYWVDRPWAKGIHGYEDFEWDWERFPDAEKMIEWIHSNNMKFLLWIAPWVTGNMKKEAEQKGYTQVMKLAPWGVDSSNAALLDFTNAIACNWWQEKGIEKMLKQGVNGFKLDRAEEVVPEARDIILSDGRTAREVRNEYPVLFVKTVHESCKKMYGDDFILISRAGYSGSSEYSGFWGGDIGSPPEGLRTAIIAVQRSAIIGFPIWGSDIGGYWQGNLDREVCARWLAFGCFNPIMEFGPTADRAPWSMDSEPQYDTTLIAIWRLYAKIHAAIAPYSYKFVIEANATGMPIVRPLFLEFPDQRECWNDWQTYLYGPDILVSAIWQKGITKQSVYLPAGYKWRDAWDIDKLYEGGQYLEVETPVYKIPIFLRENSEIELGNLQILYLESLKLASEIPDLQKLENIFFNEN